MRYLTIIVKRKTQMQRRQFPPIQEIYSIYLILILISVIALAEERVLFNDKETELSLLSEDPKLTITNLGQKCANKNVFWKKIIKHMIPFKRPLNATVRFFLYKKDFKDCGYELLMNDENIKNSGLNISHPTRFLIHGWMSQSMTKIKNAYMNLTQNSSSLTFNGHQDFNVIAVDWSTMSSNLNYYKAVNAVCIVGEKVAQFLLYLKNNYGLSFEDVYMIGHSMGAHLAGCTGEYLKPLQVNTIYALDPAGPRFNTLCTRKRLDKTDAAYVESIQTSDNFGFHKPVGHATFLPNNGKIQKSCYRYGCSHTRAILYFVESLTTNVGFYGVPYITTSNGSLIVNNTLGIEYRMGGEPSIPKIGVFYVATNKNSPYAKGHQF